MSTRYDLYFSAESRLHRLDPRVKLFSVVALLALAGTLRNLWLMIGILFLSQLLLLSTHIPAPRLLSVWKALLPTMAMIVVLWVAFYPGVDPALFQIWFVQVSWYNIAQALTVAARLAVFAFVIMAWLFTTDQVELVLGIVALGLPYSWGLTLAIALRYLPVMGGVLRMISEAQQARALDLGKGNPLQRARNYIPIVIAMIITALRTAENLSRSLESRAFWRHAPAHVSATARIHPL